MLCTKKDENIPSMPHSIRIRASTYDNKKHLNFSPSLSTSKGLINYQFIFIWFMIMLLAALIRSPPYVLYNTYDMAFRTHVHTVHVNIHTYEYNRDPSTLLLIASWPNLVRLEICLGVKIDNNGGIRDYAFGSFLFSKWFAPTKQLKFP